MYRDNLNTVVENLVRKVDDLERDINILNSINEEYSKLNKEQKVKKEKKFLTKYQKAIITNVVSLICLCASCFLKQDPYHDGLFFLFYLIAFPVCGFSLYLVLLGWLWGSKAVDEFFDKFDKK